MAGQCSILMDFYYTKAKLSKIRQFVSRILAKWSFSARSRDRTVEEVDLSSGKTHRLWGDSIVLWDDLIVL